MEVLFKNFQLFDRDGIWTMGVKGGIIESLEHSDNFDKDIHAFSKSYDLKGRYLLPGFSDAHMHFSMLACFFSAVSGSQ